MAASRTWAEVGAVEAARGERWKEFAGRHGDPGRALALHVAQRCTGLTLGELGEAAGGMDYTAVSMAVKRLEERPGEGQSHAPDGGTAVGGEVGEMNVKCGDMSRLAVFARFRILMRMPLTIIILEALGGLLLVGSGKRGHRS